MTQEARSAGKLLPGRLYFYTRVHMPNLCNGNATSLLLEFFDDCRQPASKPAGRSKSSEWEERERLSAPSPCQRERRQRVDHQVQLGARRDRLRVLGLEISEAFHSFSTSPSCLNTIVAQVKFKSGSVTSIFNQSTNVSCQTR